MMFSEGKFKKMSQARQEKKVMEIIRELEQRWDDESFRLLQLAHLSELAELMHSNGVEVLVRIDISITLRKFLQQTTGILRGWGFETTDPDFTVVSKLDGSSETRKFPLWLILDNLRSSFNVGAIIRTAECLGVSGIYLCGCTATPEHHKVRKTAMGAEKHIQWSNFEFTLDALQHCRDNGRRIYALETAENATLLHECKFVQPAALMLGNEALGIDEELLREADEIVRIPLSGWKNSLNVGAAFAICAETIVSSWRQVETR
ncbi:MAG: RNA methyltransferase [Candidatus Cloacimonetes bacterium]|nr:RNA methyltransferase [Candidatus Cloacimonadota bacterium]